VAFVCSAKFGDIEYGYTGPPCDFTMGHLGNIDDDRDNVPDIFNAAPEVIFQNAHAETLLALDQPVRFTVVSRAVPNRNSQQINAGLPMRDYAAPIKDVTYTLNEGIGPFFTWPIDGEIDEIAEEFELQIAYLHPGGNEIEVATRNGFGAKSDPGAYVKNIFYVGLEFYKLRYEHRNPGIGLMWSLIGGNYFEDAQLELHRINYSAETVIDTVIAGAAQLQSIGLDKSGLPQYYYHDKSASPGNEFGYYVTGSFDFEYDGAMVEITSRSEEKRVIPAIPRTGGIMSAPVPNPYLPGMAEQELMISVDVPGAVGSISLLEPSSGINKAPSEGELELVTVTVYVYDVAGRRVKLLYNDAVIDRVVNVTWDGTDSKGAAVPSGMYFIKVRAGEATDARKVLIIR
ncbi:MAG: T9SS type A sorting domain-containing protein, partial [Candidatus Krumholzibacteria bacterium]|nr:T9SS type A sorting domain-containing protein [Candidatus Krumholzibacteria bacterium]